MIFVVTKYAAIFGNLYFSTRMIEWCFERNKVVYWGKKKLSPINANAKIYTFNVSYIILYGITFHWNISIFKIKTWSSYQPYILHKFFWFGQGTLDFAHPFKFYLFLCWKTFDLMASFLSTKYFRKWLA
jgi:hypothetical protein